MFATDAELDVGPCRAAALGGNLDELADTVDIDRHEGVGFENATTGIFLQQTGGVVARQASGIITSGSTGASAVLETSIAASKIARACISEISG